MEPAFAELGTAALETASSSQAGPSRKSSTKKAAKSSVLASNPPSVPSTASVPTGVQHQSSTELEGEATEGVTTSKKKKKRKPKARLDPSPEDSSSIQIPAGPEVVDDVFTAQPQSSDIRAKKDKARR